LYEIDAQISYTRASVIGGIVASLSDAQKKDFTDLLDEFITLFENVGEGGTIASDDWPAAIPPDLSGITATDGRVLVSTYATQLFSWYLGSIEGDTCFCPERHGTYFGSFYMKDIPPITVQEAVTINEGTTAQMGQAFLDELNTTQQNLATSLLDIQETNLTDIVTTRQTISERLRNFMIASPVDQNEVDGLIRQYGEYEGEMMYYYATHFATIGETLTTTQADALMDLRIDYYSSFLDYQENSNAYDCSGAWLYASTIDMPDITNTDFLFGVGEESDTSSVVQEGAEITLLEDGLLFAEGPATNNDGDLYFSDPVYNASLVQDGEHVYYLTPRQNKLVRVANDMVRPNGVIGTQDGTTLYVADHGAGNFS